MKTILILGLGAALIFVLLQRDMERRETVRGMAAPAQHSDPAPTPHVRRNLPDALHQMAREGNRPVEEVAARFVGALEGETPFRLYGTVLQHTAKHLIVRGGLNAPGRAGEGGVFALFGHPDANLIVDGKMVDCRVFPVGTIRLNTVDGATQTVYELILAEQDVAALLGVTTPPAKPGDMLRKRHPNPLNAGASR